MRPSRPQLKHSSLADGVGDDDKVGLIEVRVSGVPARLLVDTGSPATVHRFILCS